MTYLVILEQLLLAPSLADGVITTSHSTTATCTTYSQVFAPIVIPLKLGAPQLYDSCQALKQCPLYSLIEPSNPVLQVGVSLQVEAIDLNWENSMIR